MLEADIKRIEQMLDRKIHNSIDEYLVRSKKYFENFCERERERRERKSRKKIS